MKQFKYEVKETFLPLSLNGSIEAKNEVEAIQKLKEIYSEELSTSQEEIEVKTLI